MAMSMAANEWLVKAPEMRDLPAASAKAHGERRRALIVPREHGAWGLLLVPLVTGAGVGLREGDRILPLLLLLTAALALFWLRTPIESLLGTSAMRAQTKDERQTVATVIVGLGMIAFLAVGSLLWAERNRGLWLIGCLAGLAFVGQALIRRLGRPARMMSEIIGTVGLSLSAPAAYYVSVGKLDATAWMLWLLNLMFAGNQIHYVQLRIRTARLEGTRARLARGWSFALGQIVMLAALAFAWRWGLIPWVVLIAFLPLFFRGWLYFFHKLPAPLLVRRLGWSELGQAVVFCLLLIASFRV
jgi:YwiC-like protein